MHFAHALAGALKSYTRPTYVLAKADPDQQRTFERELDLIKKTVESRYHAFVSR
jgi:hypothetical protein